MKKFLSLVIALALVFLLVLPAAATVNNASNNTFATEVLRLTNAERARQGLPPLSGANAGLNAAAQRRAQELVQHFDANHTRPDGRAWHTVFDEFPVGTWYFIGENIARGQANPSAVMQSWMNSSGHRANIMGNFTHMGVGVFNSGGTYHWVQLFLCDGTSAGSAPCWAGWPSWLQWFLRIFAFGWIWMR